MKVLMLQTDIRWNDPLYNRAHAREMAIGSADVDIIVLPEMFTTGFCLKPEGVAEKSNHQTLDWMKELAQETNAAVAGSVSTLEGGKYYNRFHFVEPNGTMTTYDKRHLFSFAGEHNEYSGGKDRVVVEYKGVRILLQVCYDLRFPVFSRNRGDYDMVIYVANWPQVRIDAWIVLLRARAIENLCYVVGVNRTGTDPDSIYNGQSFLLDFKGNSIAAPTSVDEQTIVGEIDMGALMEFRAKFPALGDADNFKLE